ncbi:3D domain-containing protein [Vagococcus sp. PNs007]|uniref:3D domain-containing protein n=1 Tax=Vagococcus proximus TaxID=2991417 RepID=A0ABT5WYN8_9ENTE|nr:3D domain-containing protein [Vagococcus proximus]MDF0478872.1 3D domain-containing protein [Vagococcus proximus]
MNFKTKVFGIVAVATTTVGLASAALADTLYTVKKGDTLSQLSLDYLGAANKFEELADKNNIKDANLIFEGQKLILSEDGEISVATPEEVAKTPEVETVQEAVEVAKEEKVETTETEEAITEETKVEATETEETTTEATEVETTETEEATTKATEVETTETEEATTEAVVKEETVKPEQHKEVSGRTLTVQATAYDGFGMGGMTATGYQITSPNDKVIAVDPSVIPLGSRVYVEGYGEAIAADTGGAIQGNIIDLNMGQSDAVAWGRRSVQVTILN